jgi:hypothetical protein
VSPTLPAPRARPAKHPIVASAGRKRHAQAGRADPTRLMARVINVEPTSDGPVQPGIIEVRTRRRCVPFPCELDRPDATASDLGPEVARTSDLRWHGLVERP